LSTWISGAAVASEYANDPQASGPLRRLYVRRSPSPGKSQRLRDVRGMMALHERNEVSTGIFSDGESELINHLR